MQLFSPDNVFTPIVHAKEIDLVLMQQRYYTNLLVVFNKCHPLIVQTEIHFVALAHNRVIKFELNYLAIDKL